MKSVEMVSGRLRVEGANRVVTPTDFKRATAD